MSIGPVPLVEIDLLRRELEADDNRVVARRGSRRERDAQLEFVVDRCQLFVGELELTGEERPLDDVLRTISDGDEIAEISFRHAGTGPAALAKDGNRQIDGNARLVVFAARLHVIEAGHKNDIAEVASGPGLK